MPDLKLKVSMLSEASLIAKGANLAPLLKVLVTSKGTPRTTYLASSSFLSVPRNVHGKDA